MSHTNLFIAQNVRKFLSTKRSLKKIYELNLGSLSILRYIIDSIENNCSKKDKLETRLYQSQIATYCHCSLKTVGDHIKKLIKKKLIKYNTKLCTFYLGKILITYVNFTYPIDVSKNYAPPRCTKNLRMSKASKYSKKESDYVPVTSQSTSKKPLELIKEAHPDIVKAAWVEIRKITKNCYTD
jgi:hypothetical protein